MESVDSVISMLRRSVGPLCTGAAFRRTWTLRDHHPGCDHGSEVSAHTANSNVVSVTKATPALSLVHARSTFSYAGSAKGGEVGARNEAAFIGYEHIVPTDSNPTLKYAMPHLVNLLTIAGAYVALFVAASVGWGIFLFDLYCRGHYRTVRIHRPPSAAA